MIWHIRYLFVSVLLVLLCSHVGKSQQDTEVQEAELQQVGPAETDSEVEADSETPSEVQPVTDDSTDAQEKQDAQILSQSLLNLNQGLSPGPLHFLSLFFPALFSLLNWGNGFPAQTLLGATPDQQAAASKVVLVLAEDRNSQAQQSLRRKPTAGRSIQTDPFKRALDTMDENASTMTVEGLVGQSLSRATGGSGGLPGLQGASDFVSQAISGLPTGNLAQLLQPLTGGGDVSQGARSLLQNLNIPGADQMLSQINNLGQISGPLSQLLNGGASGNVGASQAASDGAAEGEEAPAAEEAPEAAPPSSQSNFDLLQQMLGQNLLSQTLGQQSGLLGQSFGDGNLLGQAFNSEGPMGQIFNRQLLADVLSGSGNMFDTDPATLVGQALNSDNIFGQMLNQPAGMVGQALGSDRGLLSIMLGPPQAPASPIPEASEGEAQASEISEVRVRPETMTHSQMDYVSKEKKMPSSKMNEMKIKAALQEAMNQKSLPILWFRNPYQSTNYRVSQPTHSSNTEDLQIETKLAAFERQVISELKQLQEIERQAKEMRAAAKGQNVKKVKDPMYKLSYQLSKTPVHKITREDIEKALNDEYVRKLLQKAVARAPNKPEDSYSKYMNASPIKRQIILGDKNSQPLSKDDVIKMLIHAYRMANVNGQIPLATENNQKVTESKTQTMKTTTDIGGKQQMNRQWVNNDGMTSDQRQKIIAQMQRQWADQQQKKQMPDQRQWAESNSNEQEQQSNNQQNSNERLWNASPMTQEVQGQRQWIAPSMTQEAPEQQQWTAPPMMQQAPEQRQWTAPPMMQQAPEQRQWAAPSMMQQAPDQRQWTAPPMMQQSPEQRQWTAPPMMQQSPEQRQWTAPPMMQQAPEQRQWTAPPMMQQTPEQRQWVASPMMQQIQDQHQLSEEMKKDVSQNERQWLEQKTQQQKQFNVPSEARQFSEAEKMAKQEEHQGNNHELKTEMETDRQVNNVAVMHPLVGEATPQIPTDADKARKGKLFGVFRPNHNLFESFNGARSGLFDDMDILELGGGGKGKGGKKHGSGNSRPTIINYYYTIPTIPAQVSPSYGTANYGSSVNYGSGYGSGGQTYGNGGYGSNAYGNSHYRQPGNYRTAMGSDEIEAMLREHQTISKIILDTAFDSPPRFLPQNRPGQLQLSTIEEHNANSYITSPTSTDTKPTSSISKNSSMRSKRNSDNYGTLQPIDEKSLEDLRNQYKNSLKEITLNPNEDPAEALIRYNAASIREALERANDPVNVGAMDGKHHIESHSPTDYYAQQHVQNTNANYAGDMITASDYEGFGVDDNKKSMNMNNNVHSPHYGYVVAPDQYPQPQVESYHDQNPYMDAHRHVVYTMPSSSLLQSIGSYKSSPEVTSLNGEFYSPRPQNVYSVNEEETIKYTTTEGPIPKAIINTSEHEKVPIKETKSGSTILEERDVTSLVEFVKKRLTNCCEKCKDRLMSKLKEDRKKNENSEEAASNKNAHEELTNKSKRAQLRSALSKEPTDKEYHTWLHEMSGKGFDSNYLTKTHQSEYTKNGKLDFISHGREDFASEYKNRDNLARAYDLKLKDPIQLSKGSGFKKTAFDSTVDVAEHGNMFNIELKNLKYHSVEEDTTTPDGYSLRGKMQQRSGEYRYPKSTDSASVYPLKNFFKSTKSSNHLNNYLETTTSKSSSPSSNSTNSISEVNDNAKQVKMQELLSMLTELKIVNATEVHNSQVLPSENVPSPLSNVENSISPTSSSKNRRRRRKNKSGQPNVENSKME